MMEHARLAASGRTTIPKAIREAVGLRDGDTLVFSVEGDRIVLRKVPGDDLYLCGVSDMLSEWASTEDEAAWRDL
ncbi:AbrB/MazE/SpoVT family DNA-binding domain-containing protein [uncultured Rhodospira sp.]|uniref:AbrB/MazE/SpoVT family DNA-binding domain-containing protein n=1 Tax=uncultured Rhodospira sp. TaxID=1936189 RepID=UPI002610587D|nr:AbrB/MazE/SpoVT family DNA-binding domain-containing protein [uncultured Rhodospira sp.]